MSNRINKPKKSAADLVIDMRDNRGITFKYTDEDRAELYLSKVNNYLRTAAFRRNYEKYQKGANQGKYIELDFFYLQELSTIDMHYRFLVEKLCSDIEHAMCVNLIRDIELDSTTDGYDIVYQFLNQNPFEITKIEGTIASPHTGELIRKYFTVTKTIDSPGKRINKITGYNDCPAWVLVEIMSFGSLTNFYKFYYNSRGVHCVSQSVINMVRSLRNAAAHNNCILYDLHPRGSSVQGTLNNFLQARVPSITRAQRTKRLKSRALSEFVALVFLYDRVVVGKVRAHRIEEIRELFEVRMVKEKDLLGKNQLLKQSYLFAYEVLKNILL